ncbi:hypothetical protein CSUI_009107, partial [Cystoisospora suis]
LATAYSSSSSSLSFSFLLFSFFFFDMYVSSPLCSPTSVSFFITMKEVERRRHCVT